MCLIIASPDGKAVPQDERENAWLHNSDGFGVMWVENGKLETARTLREKGAEKLLARVEGKPYVAHWRFATHGDKTLANVHPFPIHDGLAMAHNGIINGLPEIKKDRSDTWHLALQLQATGLREVSDSIKDILAKKVGSNNKLAFLDNRGNIAIVNEKSGTWIDRMWYSNLYSICEPTPYEYTDGWHLDGGTWKYQATKQKQGKHRIVIADSLYSSKEWWEREGWEYDDEVAAEYGKPYGTVDVDVEVVECGLCGEAIDEDGEEDYEDWSLCGQCLRELKMGARR